MRGTMVLSVSLTAIAGCASAAPEVCDAQQACPAGSACVDGTCVEYDSAPPTSFGSSDASMGDVGRVREDFDGAAPPEIDAGPMREDADAPDAGPPDSAPPDSAPPDSAPPPIDAGLCGGLGVCEPGTIDYMCCDNYSSQARVCDQTCAYGAFDACVREEVGEPATPTPADGAGGVSLTPTFMWSLPTPGRHGFYSNVYLWSCPDRTDACLAGFGGLGNPTTPVTLLAFDAMTVWGVGAPLPALACGTRYYWVVTPGTTCASTHITVVSWSFTTVACGG